MRVRSAWSFTEEVLWLGVVGGQRGWVCCAGVEVGVLAAVMAALYAAKNCGLMLVYYKSTLPILNPGTEIPAEMCL